jgi:hypothetical protein
MLSHHNFALSIDHKTVRRNAPLALFVVSQLEHVCAYEVDYKTVRRNSPFWNYLYAKSRDFAGTKLCIMQHLEVDSLFLNHAVRGTTSGGV